ncbi:hypothetical protein GYMLUDRAFT_59792 [Collybiopsis luxurians FD-317 M1]|uniref:Unplaced genomic scaffold GYMLUscaffold_30, whole genome shotgun sequence n=1 Tax=Collybiopsis luxurians FD-317 M1 TaxID=944289 RepID=A0A0D0CM18_9AGAR|nr:hypothetical protein GYMLUDRAFT_59792 [Collybiopsis luxurians FD-317 M1]
MACICKLYSQGALDITVQQPNEVFANFLVRFQDAALKTGYNEEALAGDYSNRFTETYKEYLTFEGVIERLINLDESREAFQEAGINTSYYGNIRKGNEGTAQRNNNQGSNETAGRNNQNGNCNNTGIQERATFTNTLSTEEREHGRKEKLCYVCGAPGHFGCSCQNRKSKESVLRATETGKDNACTCENCQEIEKVEVSQLSEFRDSVQERATFTIKDEEKMELI